MNSLRIRIASIERREAVASGAWNWLFFSIFFSAADFFLFLFSQPPPQNPPPQNSKQLHHLFPAGRLCEPRVRERARQEHAQRAAQGKIKEGEKRGSLIFEKRATKKKKPESTQLLSLPLLLLLSFPTTDPDRQARLRHRLLGLWLRVRLRGHRRGGPDREVLFLFGRQARRARRRGRGGLRRRRRQPRRGPRRGRAGAVV
jgi:hypothetical protein